MSLTLTVNEACSNPRSAELFATPPQNIFCISLRSAVGGVSKAYDVSAHCDNSTLT